MLVKNQYKRADSNKLKNILILLCAIKTSGHWQAETAILSQGHTFNQRTIQGIRHPDRSRTCSCESKGSFLPSRSSSCLSQSQFRRTLRNACFKSLRFSPFDPIYYSGNKIRSFLIFTFVCFFALSSSWSWFLGRWIVRFKCSKRQFFFRVPFWSLWMFMVVKEFSCILVCFTVWPILPSWLSWQWSCRSQPWSIAWTHPQIVSWNFFLMETMSEWLSKNCLNRTSSLRIFAVWTGKPFGSSFISTNTCSNCYRKKFPLNKKEKKSWNS